MCGCDCNACAPLYVCVARASQVTGPLQSGGTSMPMRNDRPREWRQDDSSGRFGIGNFEQRTEEDYRRTWERDRRTGGRQFFEDSDRGGYMSDRNDRCERGGYMNDY